MPLAGTRVLVTGATGAVGRRLVAALLADEARVSVLTRDPFRARSHWPGADVTLSRGDLTAPDSLAPALAGVEVVLHLASHAPPPDAKDLYAQPAHWTVSAEGTWHLVAAAAKAGVSRLVYLSSVMAMGTAAGASGQAAGEAMPCAPDTLYGRAKREAECAVLSLGAAHPGQVHTCVLRVPMVYGLDGAGNIARLVDAVARRRFPPWPRQHNRRSAVHVADVIKALRLAGTQPAAAGKLYLVTDGGAYSTRWLYEESCRALGRPVPDWTVPLWALRAAARLADGLQGLAGRALPLDSTGLQKLTGDAWYSSERISAELGFCAAHGLRAEIARLAGQYRGRGQADA
ncbi:epimerase [Thiohalocapsa halophila]|uniref:Epimerase n=2 Tax=Thiohalocapsa halophila TaxID=69359 RepID=A0ABS1CKC2_9GAMM|nr:epimerase [Thiohalocapsa halophila]